MDETSSSNAMEVLTVLKRPHVFLRLVTLIFCIVVSSCISGSAWEKGRCQFNNDTSACSYGTTIGVLCCIAVVIFLVTDFLIDRINDELMKKMINFADVIFSALWALLWFVGFCYLTDAWRKTEDKDVVHGWDGMRAAIAFSFFSTLSTGFLAVMACSRYQQGFSDDYTGGYDAIGTGGRFASAQATYSAVPSSGSRNVGSSARDRETSDTKPLTSDQAYNQSQNY